MLRLRSSARVALPIAALIFTTACVDNGRDPELSEVDPLPAAPTPTNSNVNIANPTLSIPDSDPIDPGDELVLIFSDEFDGAALDPEVWFFATGRGEEEGLPPGWGNEELQYYLPDNAQLEGGILKITARRESFGGQPYTSARLNTQDRFAFRYGRIEASIKLPEGQGIWPAFWMLSQDSPYGIWAATGEIDIVEAVNLGGVPRPDNPDADGGGNTIFGTIYYGGEFPNQQFSTETYIPSVDVGETFNTYAVEWDVNEIRWYFNDTLYATQNMWFSEAAPFPAPFDQPFYILLNVAVGGNFPGFPDADTEFPATMEVDWVRVYKGEPAFVPADPGVTPDNVVFASDPAVVEDLPIVGLNNFGSGAGFNTSFLADPDFSPAIQVNSGQDFGGEDVGFIAFTGYPAGFASGFGNFVFKVKADAANLTNFEVKFIGGTDTSRLYDLTSYAGATDLGNGWLQVVVPMTEFAANIAVNDGFLLGPLGDQGAPYSYLLTDIGFTGTAAGGNLVTNGDIETGDATGWLFINNDGSVTASTDNPSSGVYSVNVNVTYAGGGAPAPAPPTAKLERIAAGTVQANQALTISFDIRGTITQPGAAFFAEFFTETAGGAPSSQEFLTGGPFTTSIADWETRTFNVTTGPDASGGITLQFVAACGNVDGCAMDMFIDNVSITID